MSTEIWTTTDGRRLDIRWMQTQHLVNSANMVMRKSGVSQGRAEQIAKNWRAEKGGARVFGFMLYEISQRVEKGWIISDDMHQLAIAPYGRESHLVMCMQRAMIDTKVYWPGHFKQYYCLDMLRRVPDTIDACLAECVAHPTKDLDRLATKFAEYRLLPPVNGT